MSDRNQFAIRMANIRLAKRSRRCNGLNGAETPSPFSLNGLESSENAEHKGFFMYHIRYSTTECQRNARVTLDT